MVIGMCCSFTAHGSSNPFLEMKNKLKKPCDGGSWTNFGKQLSVGTTHSSGS